MLITEIAAVVAATAGVVADVLIIIAIAMYWKRSNEKGS